jgi:hypothetical protein
LNWGLLHWGMLAGLAGVAIPVVVHLMNRRRTTTVDWGAMQFLELGRRAQIKFRLSEFLLLAGRMALLAIVALALARPFWSASPSEARAESGGTGFFGAERRDVVLVIDGSGSMGRKSGQTSPIEQAVGWARQYSAKLGPGDSVAILVGRDQVSPLIAPASFDKKKIEAALADLPRTRGTSDLPMAIAEAFRLLEQPGNPARDVIVLTDGQRFPWRPDEPARWSLTRELSQEVRRRSGVSPRIWALNFAPAVSGAPNGSVGPLELSGGLITPNRPITITTRVSNAGPATLTRTAELLIDGQAVPGTSQVVGPLPPSGAMPLSFRTSIALAGSHAVAVRLTGEGDALADDDESSRGIDVVAALPVLLVDGEPGAEPLSSETDFLRAALAPNGAEAIPVQARVVRANAFKADDLKGRRVVVLANVERLDTPQITALTHYLSTGGSVMVALGDKVDASFANTTLYQGGAGWLPTRLGALKGEAIRRQAIAHPDPRTFIGPALAPLGEGDQSPLAGADLFEFRVLEPAKDASVTARLDTGDPWIVERPFGRGRVAVVAGPIDAEGGTLPVNPDFVPWAHELIYHLASASTGAHSARPGDPVVINLGSGIPEGTLTLAVTTPGGAEAQASVSRSEGIATARLGDTGEPGIYRLRLPDPPGGFAFATVAADGRESDLRPLEPAEAKALERDLPLTFEFDPNRLGGRLFADGPGSRHEFWRYLVLAALAGLCMEVWMTRRMVKNSGFADARATDDLPSAEVYVPERSHAR